MDIVKYLGFLAEVNLSAMMEATPDGIIVVNSDHEILVVNQHVENMFGYSREELVGNYVGMLIPPRFERHREYAREYIEHPRSRLMGAGLELFALRKDGSEFPVEISLSPLDTSRGVIAIAAVRDISDRKDTERALKESEEKFRAMADSAQDAFIMVDNDSSVIFWNRGAERIFGFTVAEATGKRISDLIIPQRYQEEHLKGFDLFRTTGEGALIGNTVEVPALRKDGTEFPVEISLSSVKIKEKWCATGIVRDITRRKEAEETIARRTEQLEQALVEAEAANRAKTEFLANMSHELRTPLNSIIGFSQVLKDGMAGSINNQQQEFIGDILDSGRHLIDIISDILDVSRIETGALKLELSTFPLRDCIEGAMALLKEKAEKHKLDLSLEIAGDVVEITADESKIRQAVMHLLANAVKFTPEGGRAGIMVLRHEKEIRITVWDNGIGIAEKDLGRLFQPFRQVEMAVDKKYQGTGLGLYLTKRLVDMHCGTIWVESEEGKGSRFTFTIPTGLQLTPSTLVGEGGGEG